MEWRGALPISLCMWSWMPAERGYRQLSMSKKKTGGCFGRSASAMLASW